MKAAGRAEREKEASPWLSSSFGETSSQNRSSLQHPGDEWQCRTSPQMPSCAAAQGPRQTAGARGPESRPSAGTPGHRSHTQADAGDTPRVSSLKQPWLACLSECPRTPFPSQDAATGERGGISGRPQASCSSTEGTAGLLSPQTWLGLPPRREQRHG